MKSHCCNGHPLTPENVFYLTTVKYPRCKICYREHRRKYTEKRRAADPTYKARGVRRTLGMQIMDPVARFLQKFTPGSKNDCWEWNGTLSSGGYGVFFVSRNPLTGKSIVTPAHRYSYEYYVREIPAGLHIDHVCCNKRCINPSHLEPVTPQENLRRGRERRTHYKKCGHPITPESTGYNKNGKSVGCKTCYINKLKGPKLFCPAGHEYTPENTYHRKDRKQGAAKMCKTCMRNRSRETQRLRRAEKKHAAAIEKIDTNNAPLLYAPGKLIA